MKRLLFLYALIGATVLALLTIKQPVPESKPIFQFELYAVPLSPPPAIYRVYWHTIEHCMHLYGDFDKINFYIVPGPYFPCPISIQSDSVGGCLGFWRGENHNIYITSLYAMTYQVVGHEMAHELLGANQPKLGEPHPPIFAACGVN